EAHVVDLARLEEEVVETLLLAAAEGERVVARVGVEEEDVHRVAVVLAGDAVAQSEPEDLGVEVGALREVGGAEDEVAEPEPVGDEAPGDDRGGEGGRGELGAKEELRGDTGGVLEAHEAL